VGEANQQLRTSQVVYFDGSTLKVGENSYSAPGISSAIRAGWLLAVDGSTETEDVPVEVQSKMSSRLNSQALLDQYKVVPSESRSSDLPPKQPRPLIDFGTKVISDADEEEVNVEDALPSIKAKKEARKALSKKSDQDITEFVPNLEVLSDGGAPTQLQRQPRVAAKRNILDTLPLVNTKVSIPTVEPNKVFGGVNFDPEEAAKVKTEGLEVLSLPPEPKTKAPTSVKKAKRVNEEHQVLAQSVGAEPLAFPMGTASVPENWKNLSFRDRKAFVESTESVDTLRSLLLLEKGAVKKFIASKLETLSNA